MLNIENSNRVTIDTQLANSYRIRQNLIESTPISSLSEKKVLNAVNSYKTSASSEYCIRQCKENFDCKKKCELAFNQLTSVSSNQQDQIKQQIKAHDRVGSNFFMI